ncbi:hypothetical protein GCG54_00000451 [Colletotrichum gloeosporioides]|uniref:Ankyrin repeat protein n=1 Tax=Colletotrichum gloeosporioides TaxID=474922 RepID=A0A8H4CUT1_COLGL|nr:uncharacterized protein GCG54_00000451 [Colletotrichum gloeosporioides]KAF3810405.1 hypothetical protein GCG54_00000451 [Colletotrichum gloeosporioides]
MHRTIGSQSLYANALQAAALGGHMDVVTKLFEKGADVNFRGGEYGNLLQAAAVGGNIDVVVWVIGRGADVNAQGGPHETALHAASRIGSSEVVTRLLAEGARADRQDVNGFYPLQIALQERHPDIANLLLPKSTAFLASIKASDWRHYYGDGNDHVELYFDPIPAVKKISEKDLRNRSYPFDASARLTDCMVGGCQDFMADDIESSRILCVSLLH